MRNVSSRLPMRCITRISKDPATTTSSSLDSCLTDLIWKNFLHQCPTPCLCCPFWFLQKILSQLASLEFSSTTSAERNFMKALFLVALALGLWVLQLFTMTHNTVRPRWVSGLLGSMSNRFGWENLWEPSFWSFRYPCMNRAWSVPFPLPCFGLITVPGAPSDSMWLPVCLADPFGSMHKETHSPGSQ